MFCWAELSTYLYNLCPNFSFYFEHLECAHLHKM